jgi:hypothetical protein
MRNGGYNETIEVARTASSAAFLPADVGHNRSASS